MALVTQRTKPYCRQATSVLGLKLKIPVYEALSLSDKCMRPSLKLLVYEALSTGCSAKSAVEYCLCLEVSQLCKRKKNVTVTRM